MTATRTTHTKLTFYQAEGGRGGNTQERGAGHPGKVVVAENHSGKDVCVCVCGVGWWGGTSLRRRDLPAGGGGGGIASQTPPPPAASDRCRDTVGAGTPGCPGAPRSPPALPCMRALRSRTQSRGPRPVRVCRCHTFPNFPKLPLRSPPSALCSRPPLSYRAPGPRPPRLLRRKRLPWRRGCPGAPNPGTRPARGDGGRTPRQPGEFPRPRPAAPGGLHSAGLEAQRRPRASPRVPACPRGPLRACGRRESQGAGAVAPASRAERILAANILQECK